MPAAVFVSVLLSVGDRSGLQGWAVPTATDIAFALSVLAVFGKGLPRALWTFLLTLAVVDDLLAIIVIAAFYSDGLNFAALGVSVLFIAVFALVVRARKIHVLPLLLLAVAAWFFMHESGVHPTISGVAMGLSVPARPIHGETQDRCERFAHALNPLTSVVVLPLFAFFAAGVNVVGLGTELLGSPVFYAVALALVFGKFFGVLGTTAIAVSATPLRLPDTIGLRDLVPVGFLTGMGFTVSLLITELSFTGSELLAPAKAGVLLGTFTAALFGALTLWFDGRRVRSDDPHPYWDLDRDASTH